MRSAETILNIMREGQPSDAEITGEPRDTETVTRGSEGGDWKSTRPGNSLVAYPTSRPVRRGAVGKGVGRSPRQPPTQQY